MDNRRKFFLNGFLMTAVNLALRTVGLLFGAYISREVGAEGIGLHTLIMTVYSFAVTFATSGISLTVTRLVASSIGENTESHIGATMRGAVVYSLIFSGAATAVLVGFSGFFASAVVGDVRAVFPLQILSLSLIPCALSGVFFGYFIGVKRVVHSAAIQVIGQLFRIGLTVYLLASLPNRGVEEAVSALCIGSAVTDFLTFIVALAVFLIDRSTESRKHVNKRGTALRPVASMAFPLGISAYIRSALLSLEHSLIPKRLEKRGESLSEALSSFGIMQGMALPMILYPMSPLSSFSGLLVPEFAEAESAHAHSRASHIAAEAITATLIYSTATAVIMYLFSEELGYTVYNSYDAGYFISLMAPVIPIMYLDHVVDSVLKGIGEHVYSMWVNIIDSTLSVALVWFLIPVFGISGYAFVIVGMEGFNFLLSLHRLRKRIDIRINYMRAIFLPAFSAFASAALVRTLFAVSGSGATAVDLTFKIIFSIVAFIAFNIATNAVYNILRRKSKHTT